MKISPYLTFNGDCEEALKLYEKAFETEATELVRFSDIPSNPDFTIPEEFKNKILQAVLKFGDDFIRLSDCGPGHNLNAVETELLSIAVEAAPEEIKTAFAVLAEEGRVGIALAETFYSPCAGVVFDKFGIMWNFVGKLE